MREDMRTAWTKTVYETKARSVMGTVGVSHSRKPLLHSRSYMGFQLPWSTVTN